MEDELDMETQLEREFAAEQEELLEVDEEEEEEEDEINPAKKKEKEALEDKQTIKEQEEDEQNGSDEFLGAGRAGLSKVRSLPSNFTYNPPADVEITTNGIIPILFFSILLLT